MQVSLTHRSSGYRYVSSTKSLLQFVYFILIILLVLISQESCFARYLNPSLSPTKSETLLEKYFRLAFSSGVSADFDSAMINYRRAASISRDKCDALHARAGERAAIETKKLLKRRGSSSKMTQDFWGRLQRYTSQLSCVSVKR